MHSYFKHKKSKHNYFYLFIYPPDKLFDNSAISGEDAVEKIKLFDIKVNSKFA